MVTHELLPFSYASVNLQTFVLTIISPEKIDSFSLVDSQNNSFELSEFEIEKSGDNYFITAQIRSVFNAELNYLVRPVGNEYNIFSGKSTEVIKQA